LKTIVKLRDGTSREFMTNSANEWYRCEVEGNGCLSVYRVWDGGVCLGKVPEASFAEGTWLEWGSVHSAVPE